MSVENSRIIDYISSNENSIVLTISDHLEWDDQNEHIYILQEKINAYLMAIESGQLNRLFPSLNDKEVIISVMLKYKPNENGLVFLNNINKVLTNAGYCFSYRVLR